MTHPSKLTKEQLIQRLEAAEARSLPNLARTFWREFKLLVCDVHSAGVWTRRQFDVIVDEYRTLRLLK